MLATVSSNFLKEVDYKKTLEAQDETKQKSEELTGNRPRTLSDYSYLDRKLKLNLESSISVNISYVEQNNRQKLEFDVMLKSVNNLRGAASGFVDVLESFKNSHDTDGEQYYRMAEIILQDVINALNTEFGGKYLFAGNEWLTEPVDTDFRNYDLGSDFSIHSEEKIFDATYYHGGMDIVTIKTIQNATISHNITARDDNFAGLMNLLNAFINHKMDDNKPYLDDVINIVKEIVNGIDSIISNITTLNAELESYNNALEQTNSVFQEVIDDNNNFNMLKVYTELMEKNKDLESSLEMNAKIDKSRWRTDR